MLVFYCIIDPKILDKQFSDDYNKIISLKLNFKSSYFCEITKKFLKEIMEYTIGSVSDMFDIPASTLRFYDREGLFTDIPRSSGIRKFRESDVETLRIIECLKKTGLEIKDIKKFIGLCRMGKETYEERKKIFEERKIAVEEEMEKLRKTLAMLEFKCWYYETAIKDGGEENIKAMLPSSLPENVQKLYDFAHE